MSELAQNLKAFDRMIERVKADAWDEGSDARWQYASDLSAWGEESQIRGHNPYPPARPQNPYREAHDD